LLRDVIDGRVPLVVDTWVSLLDVEDCVEGHRLAAERGLRGERYVLSGATLSIAEALDLTETIVSPRRRVRTLPRALARAAGGAGDLAQALGLASPLCTEAVRVLLHGHRYDGSRARRELGLAYTPIRRTFERTLAWFAEEGLIGPVPRLGPATPGSTGGPGQLG
jgi:dihydroflavonol-4-reductase